MAMLSIPTPRQEYGLAVSSSHLVYSEIVAVTSAMRKNSRWSGSSRVTSGGNPQLASSMGLRRTTSGATIGAGGRGDRRESDLMGGFEDLKREMRQVPDVRHLPLPTLLSPFLTLIQSPLSTGPITSTALVSLKTFFTSGLIVPASLMVGPALIALSNALSHLRFESSDSAGDEIVLLRMLGVIREAMTSPVGAGLGDVEVCELLEAVLTVCCQTRHSEILRRSAESTMHELVQTVFSRLSQLDPVDAERQLKEEEESEKGDLKMSIRGSGASSLPTPVTDEAVVESSSTQEDSIPAETHEPIFDDAVLVDKAPPPYGLLSIHELLRVVINLLDPTDPLHTDTIRLTALGILNAALEVSAHSIGSYPTLSSILLDKGCKFLFQLASSDNLAILQLSLRVISVLMDTDTMRRHLKLQQELFISFTLDRLAPARVPNPAKVQISLNKGGHGSVRSSTPSSQRSASPMVGTTDDGTGTGAPSDSFWLDPENKDSPPPAYTKRSVPPARGETRELLLETLGHLARQPSFMGDLWANYDCDLNCEDVFERLIGFLTRGVHPTAYIGGFESQQYTSQLLCLDLLLTFVNHMAARSETSESPMSTPKPSPESTNKSTLKARKRLLLTGTARFNAKPKTGLAYLEENGLLYSDLDSVGPTSRAKSLAIFLKNAPRLDKKLLGDFISRPENQDVLSEFIGLYDFRNKSIADGLRELLESFRLPGESQQIARITQTFAETFFASEPVDINSQDAVFILSYAVIMLNTDQHSPNIRKRMSLDDFKRNLRGVNENADFSPEYLQSIYDSIRKREIIMPEEHTGQAGFDYAWKELLQRSRTAGPLVVCNTAAYDESMFKLSWKSIISSIAYAFTTFDDEYVIQSAIAGFRQCATLAGKFQLPEVFDFVVMSLSHATGLLDDYREGRPINFPTVEVDGQDVTVSSLSIKFGTSFRGQLAAVVLFTIANGNGNAIREGWTQIFEMFQTLFLHSLLPTRMLQTEDFLGGHSMIPMQGNATTPIPAPSRSDGGLLSALSSYLMTPYNNSTDVLAPEVTDGDVESTMSAIDCIAACQLDELYTQIILLELDALVAAMRAIADLADRRTVDRLIVEEREDPDFRSYHHQQLPYDPASVFLLETMVSIAVQTKENIEEIWPIVFHHLSGLLTSASRFSMLLIERAVVGLFRIALIVAKKPALRDQLYIALDLLGSLPPPVVSAVAEQLISGVTLLIKNHREVISSPTEWALVYALIRGTVPHHGAGKLAFDLVAELVASAPEHGLRIENVFGLVSILEEFAAIPARAFEVKGQRRTAPTKANARIDPSIERGVKAIDTLFEFKNYIPELITQSALPAQEAWGAGWTPLLEAFARQAISPSPEIRGQAISSLQRILLGPQIDVEDDGESTRLSYIFNRVIFPVMDELLQPQPGVRDQRAISETRLRASTLLCKSFLHFEMRPSQQSSGFQERWLVVLDFLDQFMRSGGRQDQLYEAIPESLKNVILVMHASEFLAPPQEPDNRSAEQKALWAATFERVEQFLPAFLEDIIPAPTPPVKAAEPQESPTETPSELEQPISSSASS